MPSMMNQIKYELSRILKHPFKLPSEAIDYLDPTRYILTERFFRKPNLNADLASGTEATREPSNPDFELLGTNAVSADSAFATTGGVTISTHGASADSTIILPHLDTSQSAWASTVWGSSTLSTFETVIVTGASVALTSIWAGFKLTNTPVVATDDDQVFVRYDAATNSGCWQVIHSRAGTDSTRSTTATEVAAVAASTKYRIRIAINAARQFRVWINDYEVKYVDANGVTQPFYPALTASITFIPYIGVLANTAAVKSITCRGLICSRV